MNIFDLRDRVLGDYQNYVEGFLNIKDERIRDFVAKELSSGVFWPAALIQLNPSFEMGRSVSELVNQGLLDPLCEEIFQKNGSSIKLFDHQERAISLALQRKHYIMTTGTGSGKSLTYIIPIIDRILKNNPGPEKVRALIVYPMNALINSQEKAIEELLSNLGPDNSPIRFARYTGQEDAQTRENLREHPPHILLTNYVMLELMMSRPKERVFLDHTLANLEFLVLDELHTYTGRQGADVSMLVRRVRRRCGNPELLCIGTSATMVAGGTIQDQRAEVASAAGKIFGVDITPEQVVDERLKRSLKSGVETNPEALRQAVIAPTSDNYEDFVANPLAAWIEDTFGIKSDGDFLRRQTPITLAVGAEKLSSLSGIEAGLCAQAIRNMFQIGSKLRHPDGTPVFAIRLHQFISKCESVYSSLESPEKRYLTLSGQRYARTDDNRDVVLAPLVFCRECGQEYYRVSLKSKDGAIEPRLPKDYNDVEDESSDNGYVLIEGDEPVWEGNTYDLPDTWFKESKTGLKLKPEYAAFEPKRIFVSDDAQYAEKPSDRSFQAWFLKAPFLTCLSCGAVYDKRTSEFRKLATLSSEGRSTATTLLCSSTVTQMQQESSLPRESRKILSFTDNRQDASLQAGHFNDFLRTGLLRSAIYKALPENGALDHSEIAKKTVDALNLAPEDYARNPGKLGIQPKRNQEALVAYVEYCIYADLRRGWRLVQPNLEQCGLLKIEYPALDDVCRDGEHWKNIPVASDHDNDVRFRVCRAILNHLRYSLALDANSLQVDNQIALRKKVNDTLKDPWRFDDDEILRESTWFVFGDKRGRGEISLGPISVLGKYLRSSRAWPDLDHNLNNEQYLKLITGLVGLLNDAGYLEYDVDGDKFSVRMHVIPMSWLRGDEVIVDYDPVRSRRMASSSAKPLKRKINTFFQEFYRHGAERLSKLEAREHTGQTSKEDRKDREARFRAGDLSCLFCSPTMELGIDIADLNTVNLRNVPPSPANYAQRSGRAGRSGQPAFITTYCSTGSGHDQYFFRRPTDMVSGVVAPPRLDLANEELVKSHVHAVWLAQVGFDLEDTIANILDLSDDDYPMKDSVRIQMKLNQANFNILLKDCRAILAQCGPDLDNTGWYNDQWLQSVLNAGPQRFDDAFGRWRELYRTAQVQLEECHRVIQSAPKLGKGAVDSKEAEIKAREAQNQRDILLNRTSSDQDSDFYPYRYLAAEGFLPGYNFPRLPVRAYFPRDGKKGAFLSRARFLALTEYGPRNVIYHEGRKYRVVRNLLPPTDQNLRFIRAKLCKVCGYFHTDVGLDTCERCKTQLSGDDCEVLTKLLEMTTVSTQRTESISCDEEERIRQGYETSSHYRFSRVDGKDSRLSANVHDAKGNHLLELTHGPSADMWRINRKWRRGKDNGYTLSLPSGFWKKRENEASDNAADVGREQTEHGVQILVRDTRNILLVKPSIEADLSEEALVNLQHALQKGICAVFQVDEDEIGSERIGVKLDRSILMWEAAEGGVGILRRLVSEPAALSQVARAALEICHYDPDTGQNTKDETQCSHACYECLLTYRNQWDHGTLDRKIIKDLLLQLRDSRTEISYGNRSYDDQYEWLTGQIDPKSKLEKMLLDYLYKNGRRLPDHAQKFIAEPACSADFFYDDDYVCVFCDGSVHDAKENRANDGKVRDALMNNGYRVVVIRYDRNLAEQVQENESTFGVVR